MKTSTTTTTGSTSSSTSSSLLMDVHSGISTTSDSQNATFAACVDSCSFSFQGFEDFSKLCRATEDHIMKHTGLVVHIGDVVGLLPENDLRHLDDAELRYNLLPDSSAFSNVLAASISPPSAESTRAGDPVEPRRVHASASPPGEVAVGRALPSGPSPGSPSVCHVAPPGLPSGSPASGMPARSG